MVASSTNFDAVKFVLRYTVVIFGYFWQIFGGFYHRLSHRVQFCRSLVSMGWSSIPTTTSSSKIFRMIGRIVNGLKIQYFMLVGEIILFDQKSRKKSVIIKLWSFVVKRNKRSYEKPWS